MRQPVQWSHAWNRKYYSTEGTEKAYLLLELKGNAGIRIDRAPVNLALVLDRSGSMAGSPLQFSKRACQFVVDQMSGEDTLSMVAFDDQVMTVFPPERVIHKDLMKQKIGEIEAGGITNLSGGLIQGAQYVTEGKKEGAINRVILLSDGHANAGVTDHDILFALAREYRTAGVGITAMGVGEGFDEELMEGIAEHGGGNFYYIEKVEDIPGIFARELEGLLSVVAQNVRLTLKVSELAKITGIYGTSAQEGNGEVRLSLGDVYDQEVKSVLLEFTFFPHEAGIQPVLEVEWQYIDVTDGADACTAGYRIDAEFTGNIALLAQPADPIVEKQVKITETARTIEEAIKAFDQGDYEKGKTLLQKQACALEALAKEWNDNELLSESQFLYSQLARFAYNSATRKRLHQQKYRRMKRKK